MAKGDVLIRILGDAKPLAASVASAEKSLGQLGVATSGAGAKVAGFSNLAKTSLSSFGVIGVAALGAVAASSVKAADAFEVADGQLVTAQKAAGQNFGDFSGKVAATDQKLIGLGFTSAETEQALARLVVGTKDVGEATQRMGLATDLARFKNMSLEESASLLVKVNSGLFRGLAATGIKYKDLSHDAAGITEAFRRLSAATKGQADAFGQTLSGKLKILSAEFNELKVAAGQALVPILASVAHGVSQVDITVKNANKSTDGWLGKAGSFILHNNALDVTFGNLAKSVDNYAGHTLKASENVKVLLSEQRNLQTLIATADQKGSVVGPQQKAEFVKQLAAVEKELAAATGTSTAAQQQSAGAMRDTSKQAKNAALGVYSLAQAYKMLGLLASEAAVSSVGQLTNAADSFFNAATNTADASDNLNQSIADLTTNETAAGGASKTAAQALFDQIDKTNALRDATQAVSDSTYDLAQAQKANQSAVIDLKNATKDYRDVLHGVAADSIKGQDASENLARARIAQKNANLDIRDAERALHDARKKGNKDDILRAENNLSSAKLNGKDATRDLAEAQRVYNGTLNGFSKNSKEARDAQDRLTTARDNEQQALRSLREATDTAHDATQGLTHAQLDLKGAFDSVNTGKAQGQIKTFDQKLRTVASNAIAYGNTVALQTAQITGKVGKGILADIDLLKGLELLVPALKPALDSTIQALTNIYNQIPYSQGGPTHNAAGGGGNVTRLAAGGVVTRPTFALVGESGPEAVVPLSRSGGFGGTNIYLTVYGADPNAIVEALRVYQRNNGSVPIITRNVA